MILAITDADLAAAVVDLYARAEAVREALAPMGIEVQISISVRLDGPDGLIAERSVKAQP